VVNARREPMIWLQLLGAAAMPLELLLILLLLAGADPGPVPALERLLAWGLGALGPALLLWRYPADPFSLLLAQVPLRARSSEQRRLSAWQSGITPRLLVISGAALLLVAFWWLDANAALAGPLAPLPAANRLVLLLLSIPLLALLLWQWQQLGQAVVLLTLSPASFESISPLSQQQLQEQRLCLGLPLLLLPPFVVESPRGYAVVSAAGELQPPGQGQQELERNPATASAVTSSAVTSPAVTVPAVTASAVTAPAVTNLDVSVDLGIAVEPEQTSKDQQGSDLDQQIG
jgi:hypothetical protein